MRITRMSPMETAISRVLKAHRDQEINRNRAEEMVGAQADVDTLEELMVEEIMEHHAEDTLNITSLEESISCLMTRCHRNQIIATMAPSAATDGEPKCEDIWLANVL